MNAVSRIREWFTRVENTAGTMTREDVCFLMVQVRHLIELAGDRRRYRTAAFYSDWTVHTSLDRAEACFEALRDITAVIARNFTPTAGDLTTQVSSVIGFPRLRAELNDLFASNGLPVTMFQNRENWRSVLASLLWLIEGTPISFPTPLVGKSQRIHAEMLALPRPHNICVYGLRVVNHEGVYYWQLAVGGDKPVTIMGQVELAEVREAFQEQSPAV